MRYCIITHYWNHDSLRTASVKGRDDRFYMLEKLGCKPLEISWIDYGGKPGVVERVLKQFKMKKAWEDSLSEVTDGDVLVFHNPPAKRFMYYSNIVKAQKDKGARVVVDIYDVDSIIRDYEQSKLTFLKIHLMDKVEQNLFEMADAIIAHNDVMKQYLVNRGIDEEKIVCEGIFDFLYPENIKPVERPADGAVIFAGDLRRHKSEFLYHLPEDYQFNLYGQGYENRGQKNVKDCGSARSEELLELMDGSYGLVWGGPSADSCVGSWGRSIHYENPHKVSLYLAAGIPLIVFSGAAIRSFVEKYNCGIFVDSLTQIADRLSGMSQEEYDRMKNNAVSLGNRIRRGEFSRNAMEAALDIAEK